MEFLVAGFEIIEQEPGIEGIYKAAELPGRICYGSQDRISPGSAEKFINGLIKSSHNAPLEHGTVYLQANDEYSYYSNIELQYDGNPLDKYGHNPYSKCKRVNGTLYVTTNLRVLVEHGWLSDLDKYWCEPTQYHERRVQVRFTIDRFTGEEFLRHRKASFNRESTRYVLFTREKFGGGSIKYIVPVWLLDRIDEVNSYTNMSISDFCRDVINVESGDSDLVSDIFVWEFALKACEWSYCKLTTDFEWKAEQARTVLPCAINSPLIKTAFVSDWKYFFDLRAKGITGRPHPQASELAEPLMKEFIKRGYMESDF